MFVCVVSASPRVAGGEVLPLSAVQELLQGALQACHDKSKIRVRGEMAGGGKGREGVVEEG